MDSRLLYALALVIGCWVLAAKGLKLNSTHPIAALKTPISRDECSKVKSCFETPEDCDPSGDGTCLFASVSPGNQPSFELRGNSESYIVLIISKDKNLGGGDAAYVCAQYNNTPRFFTTTFDNGSLTVMESKTVSNVMASVNKNVIRCTFTVLGPSIATNKAASDSSYLFAGTGNFSNGVLGAPKITLQSNGSVNLTSTNMPSPSHNMTTTNMTSPSHNMTTTNMTSPSQNMTSNNMTSPSHNMTTTNMTSPSQNMTSTNMTSPSQTNTILVGNLINPFTRADCAKTKLCLEFPAGCDPSSPGSCLFVASRAASSKPPGTDIVFEIRGNSSGYIVLILSPDENLGGGDKSFICAQYKNKVRFFTANFNNGALTKTNGKKSVKNVQASLNENVIRCTFTALEVNATAIRSADTSYHVAGGKGSFDGVKFGKPEITLRSNGSVDLTNSTSNLQQAAGANGGAGLHPTSLVLLVLLSALISRLV